MKGKIRIIPGIEYGARTRIFRGVILCLGFFLLQPVKAQLDDPLVTTFYEQLYSYKFVSADSTLERISARNHDTLLAEMTGISYEWWMLISGAYDPDQADALLLRIRRDIDALEGEMNGDSVSQEHLLQLILLYSYQSRIQNVQDKRLAGFHSFRQSYTYFKLLRPCKNLQCDIYNLVAGMYYALTGYIRKDYPALFLFTFERQYADVEKGLALLTKSAGSSNRQIRTESLYFHMKIYYEVENDARKALPYAGELIRMFPENLVFRFNQLLLFDELNMQEELRKGYDQLLELMNKNEQLTEKQRAHLLEECNDMLEIER